MTSGWHGARTSGDTAWVWFQNQRFRYRKVGGATVLERLYGALTPWSTGRNINSP